jgi:hypothetical protein
VGKCNAFGGKRIAANLRSLELSEEAADQMNTLPIARKGFSKTHTLCVKQRPISSTQQRAKLSSSATHFRLFFPLLEPEGLIPGFQDVAVMSDAIE